MKKFYFLLFFLLGFLFSIPVFAEISTNSGFIPGQIWYSKETLIEGETVNVHTAVWNSEKESISIKVEFYDKNVILGSRDVTLASAELRDVYVPWKITAGDHVISAKIISSISTISGKKENIVLGRNVTSNDKKSVSVVVKNEEGKAVSSTDALKNQIEQTSSDIGDLIPDKVSAPLSSGFDSVDNLREETFSTITNVKNNTQKELTLIKKNESEKTVAQASNDKKNIEDAVKKPIAYIKLFLFSILYFVFGHKIVFYGVLIVILFYILRGIYRKIRHR